MASRLYKKLLFLIILFLFSFPIVSNASFLQIKQSGFAIQRYVFSTDSVGSTPEFSIGGVQNLAYTVKYYDINNNLLRNQNHTVVAGLVPVSIFTNTDNASYHKILFIADNIPFAHLQKGVTESLDVQLGMQPFITSLSVSNFPTASHSPTVAISNFPDSINSEFSENKIPKTLMGYMLGLFSVGIIKIIMSRGA